MKTLNLAGYFFSQYFSCSSFSGCRITAEGLKSISNFLSHDGIVLENLFLSLDEKKNLYISTSKQTETLEMKVVLILLKDWKRTKHWKDWVLGVLYLNITSLADNYQVVESLVKEWRQFPVLFRKKEYLLRNWIYVWKKKKFHFIFKIK